MTGSSSLGKVKKNFKEWLPVMLRTTYSEKCPLHNSVQKFFCIVCVQAECLHCLREHKDAQQYIQIRRSHFEDVACVNDINKYFDCGGTKRYIVDDDIEVVYLNERPSSRKANPNDSKGFCLNCRRKMYDDCDFCCIACKAMSLKGGNSPSAGSSTSVRTRTRKQTHPTRSVLS